MQRTAILLLCCLVAASCEQPAAEVVQPEGPAASVSFISVYEGTIDDKHAVTMRLEVDEGKVNGKYYYKKYGNDVDVRGTVKAGQVTLEGFDASSNLIDKFDGQLGNGKIEGTWSKPDGSRSAAFKLIASSATYEAGKPTARTPRGEGQPNTGELLERGYWYSDSDDGLVAHWLKLDGDSFVRWAVDQPKPSIWDGSWKLEDNGKTIRFASAKYPDDTYATDILELTEGRLALRPHGISAGDSIYERRKLVSPAVRRVPNTSPRAVYKTTISIAQTARKGVQVWQMMKGVTTCPTLDALVNERILDRGGDIDGWGKKMRLQCHRDDIFVISAGPDAQFGSPDDVRVPKG